MKQKLHFKTMISFTSYLSSMEKSVTYDLLPKRKRINLGVTKGGNFIYPMMLRANFCLLFAVERAFESVEGDFQRPEFQDAAHPR